MRNKVIELIGSMLAINIQIFLILVALFCAIAPWCFAGYALWLWLQ